MDDKTKTSPKDGKRINVNELYEAQYWTKNFACTTEQLKAAVKKVGMIAKDVEAALEGRGPALKAPG